MRPSFVLVVLLMTLAAPDVAASSHPDHHGYWNHTLSFGAVGTYEYCPVFVGFCTTPAIVGEMIIHFEVNGYYSTECGESFTYASSILVDSINGDGNGLDPFVNVEMSRGGYGEREDAEGDLATNTFDGWGVGPLNGVPQYWQAVGHFGPEPHITTGNYQSFTMTATVTLDTVPDGSTARFHFVGSSSEGIYFGQGVWEECSKPVNCGQGLACEIYATVQEEAAKVFGTRERYLRN